MPPTVPFSVPNHYNLAHHPVGPWLVWLLVAISSVVFIEPAPVDVLFVGLFFLFFVMGLRVPNGIGPGLALMAVFLLSNLLASLFFLRPDEAVRSMSIRVYMVLIWLFFTCLIANNPRKMTDSIWNGWIVAAIVATSAGIVGYFELGGNQEQLIENERVRAFFKDPNVYGPFLVPVALVSVGKLLTSRGLKWWGYGLLFLYLSLGILLGYSRAAWGNFVLSLGLFIVLGIFSLERRLSRKLMVVSICLVIGVVAVIGAALSTDRISDMIEKRARLIQYYDGGEGGRFHNQWKVIQRAGVSPLGLGPGQTKYHDSLTREPHNVYLHVLIEGGWASAAAFYLFLLYTVYSSFRALRLLPTPFRVAFIATLSSTLGTLAQSFFIDSTHWRHMYLLFALLWGHFLIMGHPRPSTLAVGPASSRSSPVI